MQRFPRLFAPLICPRMDDPMRPKDSEEAGRPCRCCETLLAVNPRVRQAADSDPVSFLLMCLACVKTLASRHDLHPPMRESLASQAEAYRVIGLIEARNRVVERLAHSDN